MRRWWGVWFLLAVYATLGQVGGGLITLLMP